MVEESLFLSGGGPGLRALSVRVAGLDPQAVVRIRQHTPDQVEVFFTTPFEVVVSRRAAGTVSRDGAAFPVTALADALSATESGHLALGAGADSAWPGALPPMEGFALVDSVPVTVVRELADQGQALARQFSGPAGPPSSLMNQNVLTVSGAGHEVEVPMRMVFACTNLGLIPGPGAPLDVPRHLRVSALGRWVRLDAAFGTVYRSTRLSLF